MGAGVTGSLADFTGHSRPADFNASGWKPVRITNNANFDFKFDTGTLNATGVTIGFDTASANATATLSLTSTVTLGGASLGSATTTIGTGGISTGFVTDTSTVAKNIVGVLNITGGTVTVGTTGVFSSS